MRRLVMGVLVCVLAGWATSASAQASLTIEQKIKLTAAAKTSENAPVTLPPGTVMVWTVDNSPSTDPLGTFSQTGIQAGEYATYYAPIKPGTHKVTGCVAVESTNVCGDITLTVTAVIPAKLVISAGQPVPK